MQKKNSFSHHCILLHCFVRLGCFLIQVFHQVSFLIIWDILYDIGFDNMSLSCRQPIAALLIVVSSIDTSAFINQPMNAQLSQITQSWTCHLISDVISNIWKTGPVSTPDTTHFISAFYLWHIDTNFKWFLTVALSRPVWTDRLRCRHKPFISHIANRRFPLLFFIHHLCLSVVARLSECPSCALMSALSSTSLVDTPLTADWLQVCVWYSALTQFSKTFLNKMHKDF